MTPSLLLALALAAPQAQDRTPPDTIAALPARLEAAAVAVDRTAVTALAASDAERDTVEAFATTLTWPPVSRIVVKERDREAAADGTVGVLWEVFVERGIEGRVATWHAELARDRGSGDWRIRRMTRLSMAAGLFRLTLDRTRQFDVRDLVVTAPDLTLQMPSGSLFFASTPAGPTAVVLLGKGRLRFTPPDGAERTQVRIFSGRDALEVDFDGAFVRIRPEDFESTFKAASIAPRGIDERAMRRAAGVFDDYVGRTLLIDLEDLSTERWSLVPQPGDLIAEVRTRKYGTLTYTRSGSEAEDVAVFDRRRRRNISVYASAEKLAARGPFYSDDDLVEYDVLAYDIEAEIDPRRLWIAGTARMKINIRGPSSNTITLRLADTLGVAGISSPGLGRLLHLRTVGQNSVIVNLPVTLTAGTDLWLHVRYAGRLEPQVIEREALHIEQDVQEVTIPLEPQYLYSNRSYWYPQSVVTDYATATLRLTIPGEYDAVASGHPIAPPVPPPGVVEPGQRPRKMYVFEAREPLRYLACAISRFNPVTSADLSIPNVKTSTPAADVDGNGAAEAAAGGGAASPVRLILQANPRQMHRARSLTETAKNVFRFYASLIGEAPYPSFTLAVTDAEVPGGHSPAYFAVLNQTVPGTPTTWRDDPVNFEDYPTFFLAHEMAHQWWGQAIGWKNYHEQWLSEGFAQYFAALYGRQERGDGVFTEILRQMRSTAIQSSAQGPVYLGYRLGHIRGEGRVFRSLVYNKAAMVLHMLRRLVGDDTFFSGIRAFYREWRFRKAGTDDFRKTMERVSGRPLGTFFDDWIYGDAIPRVSFTYGMADRQTATLRFEQHGRPMLVPLTVTVAYRSGASEEFVVTLSERLTERAIPVRGDVRDITVNADHGSLARFDR